MRGNINHQQRNHHVAGAPTHHRGSAGSNRNTIAKIKPTTNTTRGPYNNNATGITRIGPSSSTSSTTTKITIKPFAKPPQLPANYYEETASTILQGTLQFLEQRQLAAASSGSTPTPSKNNNASNSSSSNYSLQSAYNSTVHLVSHQFGGRLYTDLVQTFQIAAERVLPESGVINVSTTSTAATTSNDNASTTTTNATTTNNNIMQYIVDQYTIYTDYLLLCKHVLTPLDRTWQWQDSIQKAIPITTTASSSSAAAAAASTTSASTAAATKGSASTIANVQQTSSSSYHSLQTLWQVGLTHFLRRLQYLRLDVILYQQWLHAFLNDWNGSSGSRSSSTNNANNSSSSINTTGCNLADSNHEQRYTLQQVWYLWQDLGLLSQLTIQSDLEQYWQRVSMQYYATASSSSSSSTLSSSSSSSAALCTQFTQFCYEKHIHCYCYRQWLPVAWLWNILDMHLFQQHLISNNNNTNSTTTNNSTTTSNSVDTPLLLRDENLHPILQEAVFQQQQEQQQQQLQTTTSRLLNDRKDHTNAISTGSGSNSSIGKWSTIQVLWMLAGRIHGGQRVLTTAIQRFARIQGLQRVQQQQQQQPAATQSGGVNAATTIVQPSATASTTTTTAAVQDLLQLQDCLSAMIQTLPMTSTIPGGGGGLILLPNAPLPPSSSVMGNNINNIISLKSVWEEVVNVDTQPCIAEQLAKFLDNILKNNKKIDMYQNQQSAIISRNANNGGVSDAAAAAAVAASAGSSNAWLQRIIMGIFVPLASKDIFEAFYKKDLAKRLILGRVISMDIEKQLCSLLKAECGAGYTSKMEGMFQDIEWSRETMMIYKEQLLNNSNNNNTFDRKIKPVEMEVQVLTTGYWPVYPQYPNLQLPDNLKEPQNQFAEHYKSKYQGRRMTWQYYLGICNVKTIGFNKPYELIVSLCQALTLIQFTAKDNSLGPDGGGWTIKELQRAVGIDSREEMERILQSLALGKEGTKILRKIDYETFDLPTTSALPGEHLDGGSSPLSKKHPMKGQKKSPMNHKKTRRDVDDRDRFIINTDFESNQHRIKINNILFKETKEEHDKTVEGISRDRLYLIDAVLVRIMKARKSILHQQLIPQVLEQIKVPALPADIKKRIESLIEREYMERDAKDRNRYNYLA